MRASRASQGPPVLRRPSVRLVCTCQQSALANGTGQRDRCCSGACPPARLAFRGAVAVRGPRMGQRGLEALVGSYPSNDLLRDACYHAGFFANTASRDRGRVHLILAADSASVVRALSFSPRNSIRLGRRKARPWRERHGKLPHTLRFRDRVTPLIDHAFDVARTKRLG